MLFLLRLLTSTKIRGLLIDTTAITVAPNLGTFASGTTTKAAVAGIATFDNLTYTVARDITVVGSATGLIPPRQRPTILLLILRVPAVLSLSSSLLTQIQAQLLLLHLQWK